MTISVRQAAAARIVDLEGDVDLGTSPNLRRAQPLVRAYCAGLGIGHEETGLVDSYRQALRHLHEVGAPLR